VTAFRSQLTETEGRIPKLWAKKWNKVARCWVWTELWPSRLCLVRRPSPFSSRDLADVEQFSELDNYSVF